MRAASLRRRLRWLVTAVMFAVLLPVGIFSFESTLREIHELSDGRLAQSAHTLQLMLRTTDIETLGIPGGEPKASNRSHRATIPLGRGTFESEVAFQVMDVQGNVRLATANFAGLAPPPASDDGFHNLRLDGYRWRTYTLRDPQSGTRIRAAERYDSRQDILRALLLDHSLPLLIGLPLIALLVGWAVQRGLRPLERLASLLAARAPGSREPVVLPLAPAELRPVIDALNGQLGWLEDALERERRFSADVAHELRTPLTTSLISLEDAQGNEDPTEAAAALEQAHAALNLLARRVEQLLVLARLESGAANDTREVVDLAPLAMQVIEELAPIIADGRVDMSLQLPDAPVRVVGFAAGVSALLRNLVENALRHVPGGGRVELALSHTDGRARIDVTDDGPGIPPERRADVFTRFHREAGGRGDGYGLGLSIVQRVAQLHGAEIALLDAPWGCGLRVQVTFPRETD